MRKHLRRVRIAALVSTLSVGIAAPTLAGPPTSCGNGTLKGLESCDDGNTITGDGCDANCHIELCPDGIVTLDEECDDGNTVPADGCEPDCTETPAVCGDGLVHSTDEECDDGNTIDGDGCSNECGPRPGCGNGIVNAPEECDDGNTVVGDGCDLICQIEPPEPYSPTKADQACVNAVNKAWAGVIRAAGKAGGKCLKGLSSGKVGGTFADCAQAADVGKAFDKTTKANQRKCVGKVDPLMFGYLADTAATNMAGLAGALGAQSDLLGSSANIVAKDDKPHAKCQREAHKGLLQYLDALAADANRSKKRCLKGKKVAQCQDPRSLAAEMTADGFKATHALPGWSVRVVKRCADSTTPIATLFPGLCAGAASYEDLITCSAQRAKCRFCASLNAADGLAVDCADYVNDPVGCNDG